MKISKSLFILAMLFISLLVIGAVSAADDVDGVNIIAASDLGIDEVVSILFDVINGKKELSFGEIDFMDWLLIHP